MVGEMEEVGHGLGGMVYIGLKVHDAGAVGQDARGHAVVESLAYLALILVALSEVHIVADADRLGEEADHVGGLAHGLAVGDLALALVEVLDVKAEEVAGAREGEASARGVVAEVGYGYARVPDARGDVRLAHGPQGIRHDEGGVDLVPALFPGQEKVLVVHADLLAFEALDQLRYLALRHSIPPNPPFFNTLPY